jgi:DNA-binding transcriptional MerR regulator
MKQDIKTRFAAPPKLYRIGDVVRSTSFTRQTIHNYTIMGLIEESTWTEGGHRLYDESVFEKLWQIQQLRETKTLAQIRDLFRSERMVGIS